MHMEVEWEIQGDKQRLKTEGNQERRRIKEELTESSPKPCFCKNLELEQGGGPVTAGTRLLGSEELELNLNFLLMKHVSFAYVLFWLNEILEW